MSSHPPLKLPSHEFLAELARDNPDAYEKLRLELIESFIASAPERIRPRLHGIQFRVEYERRLSRSALGTTVRLYEMMWESFLCLNESWQDVVHLKEPGAETPAPLPRESARILEFPSPPSREEK